MKESELWVEVAKVYKNKKVLDFGCGTGWLLNHLKQLGMVHLAGVDIENSDYKKDTFERIHIVPDTLEFLKLNINSFDLIICRQSIYYFEKELQSSLFNSLKSALRKDGELIILVFNGALDSSNWIYQKDWGIKFQYNEITLESVAKSVNFDKIEVSGVNPDIKSFKGKIFHFILSNITQNMYKFRFVAERGLRAQNPRLFQKDIMLRAINKQN